MEITPVYANATDSKVLNDKFFENKRVNLKINDKTVEGVIGGTIMGTIIPTMFFISTITSNLPVYAIFIISFMLSLLGQLGDLVFAFIKKEFNKNFFCPY